MSVGLDWRIEDADDQPSPSETPAGPPRPPWHERPLWRRGRWLLLVLAIALAAGGVWLYTTYRTVQDRADEDLRRALRLEARAVGEGDLEVFLARQDPNDDAWRNEQRQWFEQRGRWPATLPYTYTFRILATQLEGDRAWAEVEESYPQAARSLFDGGLPYSAEDTAIHTYRRVLFYRQVKGDWLRAAPRADSSYWGPPVTQEGEYLKVTSPARDTEVVARWIEALDPLAQVLCGDLQCPPGLQWTVVISPTYRVGGEIDPGFVLTDALELTLDSPSLSGYQIDDGLNCLQGFQLSLSTLVGAIRYGGGISLMAEGDNRPYMLAATAIADWELEHTAGQLDHPWMRAFRDMVAETAVAPLHDLFSQEVLAPGETYIPLMNLGARLGSPPSFGFDTPQAYSLVEYVAERYGREKLGAVLRAARDADSLGSALQRALQLPDLEAFERDWLDFGRARYGSM